MLQKLSLVTLIFLGLLLAGCSSMKAAPSKGAGFVPVQQMAKHEELPFQKCWIKEGMDWKNYNSIYVRPVNTEYLLQASSWQQHFREGHMKEDCREVARYMEDKFREAFRSDPNNRLRVVDSPQPGSVTLELAITELVPSNVVLSALGYAPYGGGVATKVVERSTGAVSTVAFEAKVKDASGNTVAMFADREQQKFAPMDFRGFTWYGHAHKIIDEWADQFVEVANKKPGEMVKESSPFTLLPF